MKTFTCLVSLCFATASYAGPAPTNNIPGWTPGFSLSLTGLFLQPGASDLEYAVHTEHPLHPITNPAWSAAYVTPGYSPGFDIGARYVFSQDNTQDVRMDWMYLNTNNSDSVTTALNGFVAPPYIVGPEGATGRAASAHALFDFDNINLTFGQKITFGDRLQLRLGAGVQFADLDQSLDADYTGINLGHGAFSMTSDNTSQFIGAGPRLTLDGNYFISPHVSLVEALGGAVLIGSEQSNNQFYVSTTGQHQSITDPNEMQVVPEVDAKLGAAYTIAFSNRHFLNMEAGYMASVYINAFKQVTPTSVVQNDDEGLYVNTLGYNISNFSVNGPYMTLTWLF